MRSFQKFFQWFLKDRPVTTSSSSDEIETIEMVKADLKYKSFSDCIQVFPSLQTKKYHSKAINSIYAILMSCGIMFWIALSNKKVLRVGVDIGIGIEIDDNEVYGPVLFRAYDLESRIAQYPRIVVGDYLRKYLLNLSNAIPQIKN